MARVHIFNRPISDGPTFILKSRTPPKMLLFDSSIYLDVLHMIGQSNMNERSPDMNPHEMLLDVIVSSK